ncbi:MAG: Maf family protein [Paracoccaceae bacterium]|nr:Maf family protein [Paracoccaceae bacterium]
MKPGPVILASGSESRKHMLERSGVNVETRVPGVDETTIIAALRQDGMKPRDIAACLAETKALRVGVTIPERIVIGCDQLLVAGDRIVEKAATLSEARETLQALRGRSHLLFSAAVVVTGGVPVWRHVGRAELVMRGFSDAFLESYLDRNWPDVRTSVGCYRIEESGAQLMEGIKGDLFTIMGMPLLELLAYLRIRGVLPE